jgi:trk system potassium uptake protein TrkH
MNFRVVLRSVGAILLVVGVAMSTSVAVGWLMHDSRGVLLRMAGAAALTIGCGVLGILVTRRSHMGIRDGFAIVTFSWIGASVFAAVPFVWILGMTPVDACFETMSGFTTTGASVIETLDGSGDELMPRSILYWRSMVQWLGGMGIVVLSLAILPILGVGGMQLYKAEAPGPTSDQLTPRIASTAMILWGLYIGISLAETVALKLAGMTFFEAWCHTCATLSSGGFSTRATSIKAFNSAWIDWIITCFMFLAGANFVLHLRALRGQPIRYLRDEEFRIYALLVACGPPACTSANGARSCGTAVSPWSQS